MQVFLIDTQMILFIFEQQIKTKGKSINYSLSISPNWLMKIKFIKTFEVLENNFN